MKKLFFLACLMAGVFVSCSSDDGLNLSDDDGKYSSDVDISSKDPRRRIVGTWKLMTDGYDDRSSENIYYVFRTDGNVSFYNVMHYNGEETSKSTYTERYYFDGGWTYNEEEDVIETKIYYTYNNEIITYPAKFICMIGKKTLFLDVDGIPIRYGAQKFIRIL